MVQLKLIRFIVKMQNIMTIVKDRFENAQIFDNSENDAIIPINFNINTDSKIIFVVGSNASGKSVIGKIIEMSAEQAGVQKRSCSMRNRTSGMFGQRMIFGDESDNSTGENSVSAVIKGLKSTVESENSVLILDEPDLGLADEYSAALGEHIAQEVNEHNEKLGLIVVITHSRKLLEAAINKLEFSYSTVHVGDANISFDAWFEKPFQAASVNDLLGLKEKSRNTWKRIEKMMSEK